MHSAGASTLLQVMIINTQAVRRWKMSGNSAGPSRKGAGNRCNSGVVRLMVTRAVADMAVTLPTGPHTVMAATLLHRRHLTVTVVAGTFIRAIIRRRQILPLYLMKSAARLAADRVSKAKENV